MRLIQAPDEQVKQIVTVVRQPKGGPLISIALDSSRRKGLCGEAAARTVREFLHLMSGASRTDDEQPKQLLNDNSKLS
jgi:hypothetical protein